jgi:hypothetical protein
MSRLNWNRQVVWHAIFFLLNSNNNLCIFRTWPAIQKIKHAKISVHVYCISISFLLYCKLNLNYIFQIIRFSRSFTKNCLKSYKIKTKYQFNAHCRRPDLKWLVKMFLLFKKITLSHPQNFPFAIIFCPTLPKVVIVGVQNGKNTAFTVLINQIIKSSSFPKATN